VNYWDYIKVEELLGLQTGTRDDGREVADNHELLFITVHQIYELWFKLVLRELDEVRALLRRNPVPDQSLAAAVRSLRRSVSIFQIATDHWRLVETLDTQDYLAFRHRLFGASGFQSAQLREIEIVLGLDESSRIPYGGEASYLDALRGPGGERTRALGRVERRLGAGPSYKEALYDWLARTPIDGASDAEGVERYLTEFLAAHRRETDRLVAEAAGRLRTEGERELVTERFEADFARARAFLHADDAPSAEARARSRHVRAALVFIESHRELPRLAWPSELCDATLALEQAFVIWRQRHARMVERVIGRRTGTGGSGGVEYLDATALRYRIFEDLWSVRGLLLRAELVPALRHPDDYRFRIED
jgi:tryptophan 2,3-dioxygenase